MISWFIRLLMSVAGVITAWFVAKDAPQFSIVQAVAALLLVTLIVAVLAFWPARRLVRRNRVGRSP